MPTNWHIVRDLQVNLMGVATHKQIKLRVVIKREHTSIYIGVTANSKNVYSVILW